MKHHIRLCTDTLSTGQNEILKKLTNLTVIPPNSHFLHSYNPLQPVSGPHYTAQMQKLFISLGINMHNNEGGK